MRTALLLAALTLSLSYVFAAPTTETPIQIPESYKNGFKNPIVQQSAGGRATCITGMIDVTASSNNTLLKLEEPANQTVVTELVTELLQVNSVLSERLAGGINSISGTYGINSRLCFPNNGTIDNNTIQFLIHGAGFDGTYWDLAPNYSYVDFAAEQGYTTFFYDRLGTGLSDRPDALQTVQLSMHIEIAHELVKLLRNGDVADSAFKNVLAVGHSFGSFNIAGVTASHPTDFAAAIFTGFSASMAGIPVGEATLDSSIASENQPRRFAGLSNSYLVTNTIEGLQSFFFRAPGFDPAILSLAEAKKQTFGLGEMLTLAPPRVSVDFTGPIDVVNGLNDLPNCYGNCLYPENLAAQVKDAIFPAARNSSNYLAPVTGHGLNFHYSADAACAHIHGFLKENGF
ncbi:MAG: hypothetical protein Q9159_004937 [Coniocarpon cinnabarinum]